MKTKIKKLTIPVLPNRYPYNELLFSGKLSAKTRTWKWNHTGLTLLYTSKRKDNEIVNLHNLPENHESGLIVGYGYLKPVRFNSDEELEQINYEFGNGSLPKTIYAAWYRYEFENLVKFSDPIPFKPPKGAVSVFRIPIEMVIDYIPELQKIYLT